MKNSQASWKEIRVKLNKNSHRDLLGLIGDLYALRKENKNFLDARFMKGTHVLEPYKAIIKKNICPDFPHPIKTSVARKAISDYKKAIGHPHDLAELMVYYVECGVQFTLTYGDIDEPFYSSLESMFQQAVRFIKGCEKSIIEAFLPRFQTIVHKTRNMGWGFHDFLADVLKKELPVL